ncbi:hypothetical protein [Hymenobacter mucosus]|uniref:Uncharacterized protein n=1 Tax=Hymenobacter mucosus TaxID=1411120 RepID=A0A239A9N2_9BACT|nr:hypothetical protein [Hymenobacter mucosus]SNR91593.1 hypothetical protein SAMN06269173_11141 [Hymenobacter mucosus]
MDALDELRRHPELKQQERDWLDFQIIPGPATRKMVASLLAAILRDRVEYFHPEPGDYLKAGRDLLEGLVQSAHRDGLLTAGETRRGWVKAQETFTPDALLALWGETRIALEGRRRAEAMKPLTDTSSLAA